jgi:ubiquinone/menaquinone biosynthesis C-methylase UbiE
MKPTPEQIKRREQESWSAAAPFWLRADRWVTETMNVVSERMIALASIGPKQRVLDVACGTGEPALTVARVVGAEGSVVATDFSETMLGFAREKAAAQKLDQVRFEVVDGETLAGVTGPFDAATMRFGIMFMPDPVACLRAIRALLHPGGKLALATWAPPAKNPFISLIMGVMRRHFDLAPPAPDAPGVFAFADDARIRRALDEAGFRDVQIEAVELTARYDSPDQFYEMQTNVAAPIRDALARATDDERAAVRAEALAEAEKFRSGSGLAFGAVSWVASGTA